MNVTELRKETGYGILDCQRALREAGGDEWLARGLLRFRGTAVSVTPRPGETTAQAYERYVRSSAESWAAVNRGGKAAP